jgi:hypothetical protein
VPSFPLFALIRYVKSPFVADGWNFALLHFAATLLGLWAAVHFARRRAWALAAYALLGTVMPLSSRSLQGMARYVMTTLPVPLALAEVVGSSRRHEVVLAVLALLLGLMLTLAVSGHPFSFA